MQITFDREKLLDAVNLLKGITRTANRQLPITRYVRFEVHTDQAEIMANDLEIAAVTSVSCKATDGKIFCLHGGTLAEVLASIKGQEITITLPDIVAYGDSRAVITKDRIEIGLPLVDPDDFPAIPQLASDENTFTLAADQFIAAVTRTVYASSNDDTRYVLTGLNMSLNKGTFVVVGSDGFRMAICRRDVAEGGTGPALTIPARAAKFLKEVLPEHAIAEISLEDRFARFSTNNITIISRIIIDKYPDYEAIGHPLDGLAMFRRADLLEALKRMSAVAKKDYQLTMSRGPEGLHLSVETDHGYARETIDCTYRDSQEDAPLSLNMNLKFLLDAAEHLRAEEINMQYPKTYGMIRIDEGEGDKPDYSVVIMPMRI